MQPLRARLLARASLNRSDGQTIVLMVVFMVVILGAAGLVLDVGSWYRADRAAQATTDAAALAGAQELIAGTSAATALAQEYAVKNGGGSTTISFGRKVLPNDLITVDLPGRHPRSSRSSSGSTRFKCTHTRRRVPVCPLAPATSLRSPSTSSTRCSSAGASATRRRSR